MGCPSPVERGIGSLGEEWGGGVTTQARDGLVTRFGVLRPFGLAAELLGPKCYFGRTLSNRAGLNQGLTHTT